MASIGLVLLIAALLLLRQNIVLTLAIAIAYVHAVMVDSSIEFLFQDVWYGVDREVLLSIPMFLLAGNIMARGAIAARLTAVMGSLTRPIPGGLAIATVLSLAAFSAISGSSAVTMMAIGSIMYPALLANGYSRKFALGLLCSGGTLGVIIPPSLLMIVYGIMTDVSITALFTAGWGPGLLLTGALASYSFIVNRRLPTQKLSFDEVVEALYQGIFALLMPVILLGGIYAGIFTVTESAAVSVFYAIVVETLIHRELKPVDYGNIVLETVKLMGTLMPLLAIAISLNNILDLQGVPQQLVAAMREFATDKLTLLVIVNLLLLLAGALMDETSAIIILAPLLAPLAEAYGFNAIHFGIIVTVNLQIGYVAPPVALNLMVAMVAFKERFGFLCRAVIPFIAVMLAVLVVVCAFPELSLFLVDPRLR